MPILNTTPVTVDLKLKDSFSEPAAKSFSIIESAAERYVAQLQRVSELYGSMPENEQTWASSVAKANQDYVNSLDAAENAKTIAKDLNKGLGLAFENAMLQGKGFGNMLQSLEQSIQKIFFHSLVTKPLENVLNKIIGGFDFSMPGFASGGPVSADRTILVGERGPELFRPSSSGDIVPNDKIGVGGDNINIHMTVNTPDAASFMVNQGEILANLNRAMQRGQRNL